jgi:hypothetical protein
MNSGSEQGSKHLKLASITILAYISSASLIHLKPGLKQIGEMRTGKYFFSPR